jgi:hypothetical protein
MKVQAMKDAPAQALQDLVDIAFLLKVEGIVRRRAPISSAPASRKDGMKSFDHGDAEPLDLARDVPTTPQDVAVLRRLASETPSWFSLTPAKIAAITPRDALDRRPTTPSHARPFTLPE